MKLHGVALASFGAVLLFAGAAHAQDTLSCTPEDGHLGAPSYRLTVETNRATFALVPPNPAVRPVTIAEGQVLRYGETTIFTANFGRSGYAHLFHRGSVVVIDVNRFGQAQTGTGQALTRYQCSWR